MIIPLGDKVPRVDASAFVAPSAEVIGDVALRSESGVWYTAVLRADFDPIVLGERSNLQDGVVVHTDATHPTTIGAGVSVGHRAVLHGCTVEDDCLIGMGSVILNGAVIGTGSLVAAGAVVPEGMVVPPRSLVAGVPAKVRREIDDAGLARIRANAAVYVELAALHRGALRANRTRATIEPA
jgi:carbonic anhydrase/acetyltransferase-like protein (isoleucine patch superfamily)